MWCTVCIHFIFHTYTFRSAHCAHVHSALCTLNVNPRLCVCVCASISNIINLMICVEHQMHGGIALHCWERRKYSMQLPQTLNCLFSHVSRIMSMCVCLKKEQQLVMTWWSRWSLALIVQCVCAAKRVQKKIIFKSFRHHRMCVFSYNIFFSISLLMFSYYCREFFFFVVKRIKYKINKYNFMVKDIMAVYISYFTFFFIPILSSSHNSSCCHSIFLCSKTKEILLYVQCSIHRCTETLDIVWLSYFSQSVH